MKTIVSESLSTTKFRSCARVGTSSCASTFLWDVCVRSAFPNDRKPSISMAQTWPNQAAPWTFRFISYCSLPWGSRTQTPRRFLGGSCPPRSPGLVVGGNNKNIIFSLMAQRQPCSWPKRGPIGLGRPCLAVHWKSKLWILLPGFRPKFGPGTCPAAPGFKNDT
jgi:hypothetical protein